MSEQIEPTAATRNLEFLDLTAEIVAAYVSHNTISPSDLPRLVQDVHASLKALERSSEPKEPADKPVPMVPIKKSVTPEHIICLHDGLKFASLRRHLRTHHNMTPDEYRSRWGLPGNYPMVAPAYSERRSKLAKQSGLGRKR